MADNEQTTTTTKTTNTLTPPYPDSPDTPWGKTRSGKPRSEAQYRAKLKAKDKAKMRAAMHRVTRRCSSCGLLCSLEGDDPEVNSEDIDGETLSLDVDVVLNSACCGEEVARQNFEVEVDLTDHHSCEPGTEEVSCETCDGTGKTTKTDGESNEVEVDCPDCDGTGTVEEELEQEEDRFELGSVSVSYAEDYDNTIKRGKNKGKTAGGRYSTTLRGFEYSVEVHCTQCGEDFTVEDKELAPASTFENSY